MAKLSLKQVLCSILVLLLFSPVVLATGSRAFRLAVYRRSFAGLPAFPLLVVGTLLVLMVLMWVFSSAAFAGDDRQGSDGR
jgi:hypothetical protein